MTDRIPTEALRLVQSTAFQALECCSFPKCLVSSLPIGAEVKDWKKKDGRIFWYSDRGKN